MALRCLLVGLVASLGFQLPSGQEVTSWTVSGRDWVSARTVDLSALQAEASGWLAWNDPTMKPQVAGSTTIKNEVPVIAEGESQVTSLPADLAFDSINEGMALAFADDVAAANTREELTRIASLPVASATLEPLCDPEADLLALAFPAPEAESIQDEETEVEVPALAADQEERLASAVRLTCEAVQAWASVMQSVGTEAVSTR